MSNLNVCDQHFDVLIVGGGMVGAAIACGLGNNGIKVALFDQAEPTPFSPDTPPGLRISALSTASENILRNLGAWSYMEALRMTPYRQMAVWEKLHTPRQKNRPLKTNRVTFDGAKIDHAQLGFIVENQVTQLGLLKAVAECPAVTFFSPVTIAKMQINADNPLVTLSDGRRFSGSLLVGADGANSSVRQNAGIPMTQRDYEQQCLVATVEIAGPCQDITWQAFTPTGPEAFLPLPDVCGKSYASIVWYHHPEKVRELLALSDDAFLKSIIDTFPSELPDLLNVYERGAFPIARRHAHRYYRPGVVLAGDAAHTINPLAGQGVNLGFQDAAWLIDTLTKAHQIGKKLGHSDVLQRYEQACKKQNTLMMSAMDGFYYSFSNQHRGLQLIRNVGLTIAGKLSPAINQVMKYAMGLSGKQPPLATRPNTTV